MVYTLYMKQTKYESSNNNFLIDISDWNTSSNTDFYETFSFAESFNGDLSKWDVSNGM